MDGDFLKWLQVVIPIESPIKLGAPLHGSHCKQNGGRWVNVRKVYGYRCLAKRSHAPSSRTLYSFHVPSASNAEYLMKALR